MHVQAMDPRQVHLGLARVGRLTAQLMGMSLT
jgi:hypothetical protein